MNQPPPTEKQTGKRIVSKGEYAKAQAQRGGHSASAAIQFTSAIICAGLAILFAGLTLLSIVYRDIVIFVLLAWSSVIFGAIAAFLALLGKRSIQNAEQIDPGVPLTRANTANLPASESLVRASAEPLQEPQAVLLRAAADTQERQEEQLVRASAGGSE